MIATVIAGVVTKLLGDFAETRKEKMFIENEIKLKESQSKIKIAEAQAIKEFDLKIEEEKTAQLEIETLKQQLQTLQAQNQELYKTERLMINKSSNFVVNTTALVKPITTYILILGYTVLNIGIAFGKIDSEVVNNLQKTGYFATLDGVLGFWFGAFGYQAVIKKKL